MLALAANQNQCGNDKILIAEETEMTMDIIKGSPVFFQHPQGREERQHEAVNNKKLYGLRHISTVGYVHVLMNGHIQLNEWKVKKKAQPMKLILTQMMYFNGSRTF